MLDLEVKVKNRLWRIGQGIKEFMTNEEGDTNVISIIVVLAIVLALAIFFKDKILALVNKLWESVDTNAGKVTTGFDK